MSYDMFRVFNFVAAKGNCRMVSEKTKEREREDNQGQGELEGICR